MGCLVFIFVCYSPVLFPILGFVWILGMILAGLVSEVAVHVYAFTKLGVSISKARSFFSDFVDRVVTHESLHFVTEYSNMVNYTSLYLSKHSQLPLISH